MTDGGNGNGSKNGGPTVPTFAQYVQSDGGPVFPVLVRNPKLSTRSIPRYGWRRDLPDPRDQLYSALIALSLPIKFDLREHYTLPPVYDQGRLGSCTGNAIAGAIQFERIRQRMPRANLIPSRLFIYYNERVIEGDVETDGGAQIRDGIKSVASQGDCFEGTGQDEWPYVISKFKDRPPPACYEAALHDRTVGYSRLVQNVDQLKSCLASGFPFVFGFTVYQSFESPTVTETGIVPMPVAGDAAIGGHAVMAVGYDDGEQRFTVRNSWGTSWGQQGYFTIPYAYVTNANLASDFWTIRLINGSARQK